MTEASLAAVQAEKRTLAEVGEAPVTIQKEGAGRLYFRIGMQYAPADLRPPPTEQGFAVTRVFDATRTTFNDVVSSATRPRACWRSLLEDSNALGSDFGRM